MKTERFDDIKAWQEARVLVKMVYAKDKPQEFKEPDKLKEPKSLKDLNRLK